MERICWFLVIVATTLSICDASPDCTTQTFKACQAKLPFNASIPTENLTRIDFQQNCGNVTAFKACVDALKCTRENGQLYTYYLKYQDTVDGYVYLCRPDTQKAFFANRECLRAGFSHHQDECKRSVKPYTNDKDQCRYIYDRADCARNWAMRTCNDERIARLVETVIITSHKRQYEAEYHCKVGKCQEVAFEECPAYVQLKPYMQSTQVIDKDEKLETVCSQINALRECVSKTRCAGYSDGIVDRFVETYGQLCQNGTRQAYLANVKCLNSDATKANLTMCTSVNNTKHVNECTRLKQREACMRKVYAASCGQKAADAFMTARQTLENHPCHKRDKNDGVHSTAFYTGLIICITAGSTLYNMQRRMSALDTW